LANAVNLLMRRKKLRILPTLIIFTILFIVAVSCYIYFFPPHTLTVKIFRFGYVQPYQGMNISLYKLPDNYELLSVEERREAYQRAANESRIISKLTDDSGIAKFFLQKGYYNIGYYRGGGHFWEIEMNRNKKFVREVGE